MNTDINRTQVASHAAAVGIAVNSILFILKLTAGFVSSSVAMLSDAVHSAADIASAVAILIGIKLAGRKCTKSHPYGYGRYESIAALLLSILLFITAVSIGVSSVKNIIKQSVGINSGFFAVSVSLVSIIVKEFVFRYTYKKSKMLCSEALLAEAWHHRTDVFASVGSLLGIIGAEAGVPIVDPIAGIIISLFIIKTSFSIFRDSCLGLSDTSAPDELLAALRVTVSELGIDVQRIISRRVGSYIFIELVITLDGTSTVNESYKVTSSLKSVINERFPEIRLSEISVLPKTSEE